MSFRLPLKYSISCCEHSRTTDEHTVRSRRLLRCSSHPSRNVTPVTPSFVPRIWRIPMGDAQCVTQTSILFIVFSCLSLSAIVQAHPSAPSSCFVEASVLRLALQFSSHQTSSRTSSQVSSSSWESRSSVQDGSCGGHSNHPLPSGEGGVRGYLSHHKIFGLPARALLS